MIPRLEAATTDERGRRLQAIVDEAVRRYNAMTPEEQAAMWKAQRESWVRAFEPCEHGDPDWETCPECLSASLRARGME